ncbi:hypothetical protein RFI_18833 [Reticulomyxa filosa]|uniref:Uncharacterized protein n=1 Tax=Reticulomyxa filosa TaxID=46433 RepID=X6MY94_RETFI|nr:hypothetical protein RFI_18833 [Reticulomyxa filosa]|eukprot:ETO18432.1 hypothetical protein RFI_18833 [Reticulomyxa filosa]
MCTLQFDFFPKFGPAVARGYILYEQLMKASTGALSVPLHAIGDSANRFVGKFYFEYVLIRPFSHPNCGIASQRSFPNEKILVGHRGTGSWRSIFRPGQRRTHLKENTILAFNAASALGAQFVEFDVQLTRDKLKNFFVVCYNNNIIIITKKKILLFCLATCYMLIYLFRVPVIYHDFLFHSRDFTIPVNHIYLKQWKKYKFCVMLQHVDIILPKKKKKKEIIHVLRVLLICT